MLESAASPISAATGEVEKLIIVNRDVTARKQLEDQFRQAQKIKAVALALKQKPDAILMDLMMPGYSGI